MTASRRRLAHFSVNMEKLEIVGYKRETLGTKSSKDLRTDSMVPCVLYGGKETRNFAVPMMLFRSLLYSQNVYEVSLNIEGEIFRAILQDAQFHPVNEMILHVDFMEIIPGKEIKMNVPVKFVGNSPGVQRGGKLVTKLRKITLKGQAESIPDFVEVNISGLDLGQSFKVRNIQVEGCEVLNNGGIPICTIDIPRALRGKVQA
jgi:large subunit ribosomal protein L25